MQSALAYSMLPSIHSTNFSGFADLEIPKFAGVNLIGVQYRVEATNLRINM